MSLNYSTHTHIGSRPVNEDSIDVAEKNGVYCFILCDGLGGHGKGDLASQFVVGHLKKSFADAVDADAFWVDSLDKAQEALMAEQSRVGSKLEMKTTAVVLTIDGNRARCGHIGDSRCYHFRKNKLLTRTSDHSVPQMLVLAGEIKEKHIRNHPDRNRLLRVMGVEWDSPRYELSDWVEIQAGDAFLLCSDGFWEPIVEKDMCKLLKKSDNALQWLSAMAERAHKNAEGTDMDNNSAIAVCITE